MSTYVLLPGAASNSWFWHLVIPELRRRGHDTIAVDLPWDDDSAGLPEYVDTVVKAIGSRTDLVLVAQSMSGFLAPLVAQRAELSSIVTLNAMIPRPGETPGEWWGATGQEQARREMDEREGRNPDTGFDPVLYFLHDLPSDLAEESGKHVLRVSDTPFGSTATFDLWPDVPTRVLIGRDDRLFPVEFQRRVARERLNIEPEEVPGGHLAALSYPREVAEALLSAG